MSGTRASLAKLKRAAAKLVPAAAPPPLPEGGDGDDDAAITDEMIAHVEAALADIARGPKVGTGATEDEKMEAELSLSLSVVGRGLRQLVRSGDDFDGDATELLAALDAVTGPPDQQPATPGALARELGRLRALNALPVWFRASLRDGQRCYTVSLIPGMEAVLRRASRAGSADDELDEASR